MSKVRTILLCLLSGLAIFAMQDKPFPEAKISNGIIQARLYLPDAKDGYYRGARFDWSGVMPELTCDGHSWGGQWNEKYSPTLNDAIMGPVESFSPLGYDEAGAGGHFMAIGIGMLIRKDESKYSPFRYYEVADPGTWKIKQKKDAIEFRHTLKDTAYAYEYTKTITLVKGKREMVLEHVLKNTGRRAIGTDVYNHNLFVVDHQPTGPGFVMKFPFQLSAEESRGIGEIAEISGDSILFKRKLVSRESVYSVLHGYSADAKDYDIRLENHTTGAAMRITCDQPLSKMVFWGCATTLCPEPYIHMKIDPGQEFKWKIAYEFYSCGIWK
ncbi:MAG TPA: hypothetical protein VE035_06945 [Puia sp.]|nr:hypothetical protein [Puia sp.]